MVLGVTGKPQRSPAVTPVKWKRRPSTVTGPKLYLKSILIGGAGVLGRMQVSLAMTQRTFRQEPCTYIIGINVQIAGPICMGMDLPVQLGPVAADRQ